MGRDDGFRTADIQTTYFDDAKVRSLWRLLNGNVADMTEALSLHLSTVLASWSDGKRAKVDDAVPLWLPIREDLVSALVSAKLLDATRRVPARSWSNHFEPARRRRDARVEAGRLGGIASGKRRSNDGRSDASASPNPSGRQAGPSSPSIRPSSPARAPGKARRGAGGPSSLREAMEATPFGREILEGKEAAG